MFIFLHKTVRKMVKLTAEFVEKTCSQMQLTKSLSKQIKKDQLQSLTHLRMNRKFITSIGSLAVYRNLRVIYLQNNNISKIENLQFATNLTHLYLQNNAITRIENLDALQMLDTLYLGNNNIAVVEKLENLRNLTVLHVENQRLNPGEAVCFEPRTVLTLSGCLKVLNTCGNKITSLSCIRNLYELVSLDAANNLIDDIDDLTETVSTLVSLKDLSLQGNPVTRQFRYKENLIANNDTIENLDGKTVTDVCRCFMKRFKIQKHLRCTRKASKIALDDDITSSLNLPPAFKRSISRAIFQHPGPKLSITISSAVGETQQQVFPPWKTAPGANAMRHGHVTPRPFWSNVTKTKQPRIMRSVINSKVIALPPI